MQVHRTPVALPPMLCSDFLDYVLKYHRSPTTLIICSTKEAFLEDLLASVKSASSQEPSASQTRDEHTSQYSLLIPTIHLIAKSQSVHVVFVPTLPHLRAFLATCELVSNPGQPTYTTGYSGSQSTLLAVWGLVNLHRSTAEHSAQGLSRTLASAVETASHRGDRLVLSEPLTMQDGAMLENAEFTEMITRGPWEEQVPLLSFSVRFGDEDRVWAGKTIEVRRVVAKWCRFVRLDQDL